MNGYQNAETSRQIANLAQVGTVTSVNGGSARAQVQIGDITTHDIPVAPLRAGAMSFWWMPAVGEQVLVIAPGGDMARAMIVASIFAGNAPSADAATPMIDLAGGKLLVNGDIEVTGKITTTGDVIANGKSLINHTHGGVTSGASNTGAPN